MALNTELPSVKLGIGSVSARRESFPDCECRAQGDISAFLSPANTPWHARRGAHTHTHTEGSLLSTDESILPVLFFFWHCAGEPRGCSPQPGTHTRRLLADKHTRSHSRGCLLYIRERKRGRRRRRKKKPLLSRERSDKGGCVFHLLVQSGEKARSF